MKTVTHKVDFCVIGGGMAGTIAAIAAARGGVKVALMQDRPVLGGNASGEIRMWIGGASGTKGNGFRETGILEEIFLENYHRNTGLSYSIWDSVVYEKARFEPNITLLMNCTCQKAQMDGNTIRSVTGWQLTTETYHTIEAEYFADCSGDSILAPLTGAAFMLGREAKGDFGESIPPERADKKTMGLSCLIQARETDRPQPFIPPAWAYSYPGESDLPHADHSLETNFWWIELGGEQDSIHDAEQIKDELLKIAFGVWDHIKNHGDHGAQNWVLDWVGFLPGKRESRRYVGDLVVTQNHVEAEGRFPDVVAYGGWSMDDHFPAGFYYRDGHPTIYHPAPSPWGIPLRALYSKNIQNLFFAGRNISVTHAALSSSRVMGTCGILGQALGTAAAICVRDKTHPRQMDVEKLRQKLMWDDCFLPFASRKVSGLTKRSKTSHPQVTDGVDRPLDGEYHGAVLQQGEAIDFSFPGAETVEEIRLILDSNLSRPEYNMPCSYPLRQDKYKTPATLLRDYTITLYDEEGRETVLEQRGNYQRMVRHAVGQKVKRGILRPLASNGDPLLRIHSVDFI